MALGDALCVVTRLLLACIAVHGLLDAPRLVAHAPFQHNPLMPAPVADLRLHLRHAARAAKCSEGGAARRLAAAACPRLLLNLNVLAAAQHARARARRLVRTVRPRRVFHHLAVASAHGARGLHRQAQAHLSVAVVRFVPGPRLRLEGVGAEMSPFCGKTNIMVVKLNP